MDRDATTQPPQRPTPDRLIHAAMRLFRAQGYHATGLSQILAEAGVPKGSLYHHFPGGKPDLARAAAARAGAVIEGQIAAAFAAAPDWDTGLRTLCDRIAVLFETAGGWDGCPVTAILLDGPPDPAFRADARRIFDRWRAAGLSAAQRFAIAGAEARVEAFLIALEGAWIVARADGHAGAIRRVPDLVR